MTWGYSLKCPVSSSASSLKCFCFIIPLTVHSISTVHTLLLTVHSISTIHTLLLTVCTLNIVDHKLNIVDSMVDYIHSIILTRCMFKIVHEEWEPVRSSQTPGDKRVTTDDRPHTAASLLPPPQLLV